MDPKKYQELAMRTDPDRTGQVLSKVGEIQPKGSRLLHSIIGMAGEAGELAAAIQRWLYYGKPLDETNVKEELGDMLWYVAQCANALDVDLNDVMEANIAKLKFRYPDRYTDHHAEEQHRNRTAEAIIVRDTVASPTLPPASNDYVQVCKVCKHARLHKDNDTGMCPDCFTRAKVKAAEPRFDRGCLYGHEARVDMSTMEDGHGMPMPVPNNDL